MIAAGTPVRGFASLAELQESHAALVKEVGKDLLRPANLERIAQFVGRAVATGAVLDAPVDRAAAQSLISFWTTRLGTASRELNKQGRAVDVPEFDDTLLAEFNSEALAAAVISPTEKWLDQQSEADQTLVRRLMLRLVSLEEDDTFVVVPGARGLCDELEPQDRAEELLAELVRLGVVRTARSASGSEEFALGSADLMKSWPRLKQWMGQRKKFREKATGWAKRRAEKQAAPADRSVLRRAQRKIVGVLDRLGELVETRWRALRLSLGLRDATERFLSEEEYEEAEIYRDKNTAEIRLVYQKRQHDRERQERKRVQALAFAGLAALFAVLLFFAIRGLVTETADKQQALVAGEEEKQLRKKAEDAQKGADFRIAQLYYEKGTQSEVDDGDTSGAFLWSTRAWSKFADAADILKPEDQDRLRTGFLFRLATAQERLPFLSGMAYHKEMRACARSADGKLVLTVRADAGKSSNSPVVQLWRWTVDGGGAEWKPSPLPLDASAPAPAFEWGTQAWLSSVRSNRRFAVACEAIKDGPGSAYIWEIPEEEGAGRLLGKLKGFSGELTDSGFSPDGQFFAVVSKLERSSQVNLWRTERWGTDSGPVPLVVPTEIGPIGPLGRLAFCPAIASNRLAVAVGPLPSTTGGDRPGLNVARPSMNSERTVCLEWSFSDLRLEPVFRHFTVFQSFAPDSVPGQTDSFVTYKPDGRVLLVSNSQENGPFSEVWLFNSSPTSTTEGQSAAVATTDTATHSFQRLPLAGPILDADFSPRDDRVIIANGAKAVLLSRTGTQDGSYYRTTSTFDHKSRIFRVKFSPDGEYIMTASRDCRALIWDADSWRLAHPSFHHTGTVDEAGFTDNGRTLITKSRDSVYRWELSKGESRPLPVGNMRGFRTMAADPEGTSLVTAGESETRAGRLGSAGWARVWDAATGDHRSPELQHPLPVLQATISERGEFVSTVTSDGVIRLWEARSGRLVWSDKPKLVWSDKPAEGRAVFTAFGSAGQTVQLLALVCSDPRGLSSKSNLRVYSLNSEGGRSEACPPLQYEAPFTAAVFGPSCKRVLAYAGDGADNRGDAVVWEVPSGTQMVLKGPGARGTAHDEAITHAAFSTDGNYLVTTSRDDKAFVWILRDGSCCKLPSKVDKETGHTADVMFASFDRSATRVVTAGADGWAFIWERIPEQEEFRLAYKLKNDLALTHAVFMADERYVITADASGVGRLWDVKGMRPLAAKTCLGQNIVQLVCRQDADGKPLVYLIGNQVTRVAAATSGTSPTPNPPVSSPAIGPGWPLVTEWRLRTADPPGKEVQHFAQWTASRRLDDHDERPELTIMPQDTIFELWNTTSTRRGLTTPPSNAEVGRWHELEAAHCEQGGHWTFAIGHWTHALSYCPEARRSVLLARRARAHSEVKEWKEAEDDLTAALGGSSPDSQLLLARAEVRVQRSDQGKDKEKLKEATADFQQALQADPDNRIARALLADALVDSGQIEEALRQYGQALQRDPSNPDLLLGRAQALMSSNGAAAAAYSDYLNAGRLFKSRRIFDAAEKAYAGAALLLDKGAESSPQRQAQVHAERAELLENFSLVAYNDASKRKRRLEEACKEFSRATKLDATQSTSWSGLARCRTRLGEWDEARHAYEQALKLSPDDSALTTSWARFLVSRKDWEEAAKAYPAVIKHEPKVLLHRLRLAEIYLQPIPPETKLRPDRLEAARACVADAIKEDEYLSKQSILWAHLAVVQLAAGRTDDYRATRARMFEAFKSPLGVDANNVAWAASFAPDSSDATERAMTWAAKAVAVSPNYNYLNTYGAALYRAGKREEAIKQLDAATRLRALAHLPKDQEESGKALDLVFKAMAQYTPGHPEQARQTLESAVNIIKRLEPVLQTGIPERVLDRVWESLEFEVLRREAESLINH
jgi:WD40 repeat protein/tetratricopeptide (TPR) repeat protein